MPVSSFLSFPNFSHFMVDSQGRFPLVAKLLITFFLSVINNSFNFLCNIILRLIMILYSFTGLIINYLFKDTKVNVILVVSKMKRSMYT